MAKQRNHNRPPVQSYQQVNPAAAADLRQVAQAKAQQEAAVRQRVEGIAVGIFVEVQKDLAKNDGLSDREFEKRTEGNVARSVDSALIFAREVWGINASRKQAAGGAGPVTPVPEDEPKQTSPIIQG